MSRHCNIFNAFDFGWNRPAPQFSRSRSLRKCIHPIPLTAERAGGPRAMTGGAGRRGSPRGAHEPTQPGRRRQTSAAGPESVGGDGEGGGRGGKADSGGGEEGGGGREERWRRGRPRSAEAAELGPHQPDGAREVGLRFHEPEVGVLDEVAVLHLWKAPAGER